MISCRVVNALHCPKVLIMNAAAFKTNLNYKILYKLIFYGNKRALRKNTKLTEGPGYIIRYTQTRQLLMSCLIWVYFFCKILKNVAPGWNELKSYPLSRRFEWSACVSQVCETCWTKGAGMVYNDQGITYVCVVTWEKNPYSPTLGIEPGASRTRRQHSTTSP